MEVTVEKNGVFDRQLVVRIPGSDVTPLLEAEFGRLSQSVRMPGFRPGKIPRPVLEGRFGQEVKASVAEQLFKNTYLKALEKEALLPVDMPQVQLGMIQRGEDFVYTASLQVFPQVEPKNYQSVALQRPQVELTDADIDQILERMRRSLATYRTEAERQAVDGDQVLFDFEGSVDDKPFEGGHAEGFELVLGSGRFIPGFEGQLLGATPGEERLVTVTFPATYHHHELAGKEARFRCKVREVRCAELPPMDDEIAVKAGVKEGGLTQLRQNVRQQLEESTKDLVEQMIRRQVLDALWQDNRMELPSQLLEREMKGLVEQAKKGRSEAEDAVIEAEVRNEQQQEAEKRVTLGLLLGAIARKESIQADEASISEYLDKMVLQFGEHASQMRKYFEENRERREEIVGIVLEHKVLDWIVAHGQVTEERCSLEELNKRQKAIAN
ncbi:MAG: trigger factor [Magnetococcales bacterium]|nr:trigger factor [Magnetococcales bacterium]